MASFLDTSNFLNIIYALNTQIEKHYAGLFFGDESDLSRVVYSAKDHCFRKRMETTGSKSTNLDMPFCQYHLKSVNTSVASNRKMYNNIANISGGGIWIDDVGKYVRVTPINVTYEMTCFYSTLEDTLLGLNNIHFDDSSETILYPTLSMTNSETSTSYDVPVSAFLNYSDFLVDQGNYSASENAWLETNHIHTLEVTGLSFDTLLLTTEGAETASITDEVILNFLSTKTDYTGSFDDITTVDPQTLITSYFSEDE